MPFAAGQAPLRPSRPLNRKPFTLTPVLTWLPSRGDVHLESLGWANRLDGCRCSLATGTYRVLPADASQIWPYQRGTGQEPHSTNAGDVGADGHVAGTACSGSVSPTACCGEARRPGRSQRTGSTPIEMPGAIEQTGDHADQRDSDVKGSPRGLIPWQGRLRRQRRRPVEATLTLLCSFALCACGSTVQLSGLEGSSSAGQLGGTGRATGASSNPQGSGAASLGSPSTPAAIGGDRGVAAGPGTEELAAGSKQRDGSMSPSGAISGTGQARVGFVIITDVNAAVASIGYSVDTGDNEGQATAAAAWLNARGGLAGRRVVPVFFRTSSSAVLQNSDSVQQAACTHFTEDMRVDAVVAYLPNMPLFEDCLTAHRVLVVRSFLDGRGTDAFARAGGALLQPAGLDTAHSIAVLADGLGAQDYWRGHRIGWFLPDGPETTAAARSAIVRGAFERNGIHISKDFRYSGTDIQQAFRDGSAAVLQFKAAKLDRIILTGFGGTTYFMNPAASQDYHPGYALDTDVDPSASTITVSDSRQLSAVTGVGWQPTTDIGFSHIGAKSRPQRDCTEAMKSAGQDISADTSASEAMLICDGLFFLRYGAVLANGSLVPTVFAPSVAGGGHGYDSPTTQVTDTTRRDGAAGYQILRYTASTNAFRYTTAVQRIRF